jgi:hypothetical protein
MTTVRRHWLAILAVIGFGCRSDGTQVLTGLLNTDTTIAVRAVAEALP